MQNTLQHTKEAFDSAALTYDDGESKNEILKWMREVVHEIYLNNFKLSDELLELNSGTGTDAMFLAEHGIKVFATDISDKMTELIKQKVKVHGLMNMIKVQSAGFDEINQIFEGDFDGVVSNFGGLNCIKDFSGLSGALSLKLKKGGKFIAVVMNRTCPWEILYYALRLDFKNVFRRLKSEGIDASLGNILVRTYYFSPSQFAGNFDKHFRIRRVYTLGLFTPPPFLIGIYKKFSLIVKLFMKIDELIKGIFPFNRIGDHFIIIMEKFR